MPTVGYATAIQALVLDHPRMRDPKVSYDDDGGDGDDDDDGEGEDTHKRHKRRCRELIRTVASKLSGGDEDALLRDVAPGTDPGARKLKHEYSHAEWLRRIGAKYKDAETEGERRLLLSLVSDLEMRHSTLQEYGFEREIEGSDGPKVEGVGRKRLNAVREDPRELPQQGGHGHGSDVEDAMDQLWRADGRVRQAAARSDGRGQDHFILTKPLIPTRRAIALELSTMFDKAISARWVQEHMPADIKSWSKHLTDYCLICDDHITLLYQISRLRKHLAVKYFKHPDTELEFWTTRYKDEITRRELNKARGAASWACVGRSLFWGQGVWRVLGGFPTGRLLAPSHID